MNSTPDYGEPWSADERPQHDAIFTKDSTPLCLMFCRGGFAKRAAACVSACAGMADPEKEITSLLGERDCLNRELSDICRVADAHTADEACEVILAMREAIREAAHALAYVSNFEGCRVFCADSMDIDSHAAPMCAAALAKLQPFIK